MTLSFCTNEIEIRRKSLRTLFRNIPRQAGSSITIFDHCPSMGLNPSSSEMAASFHLISFSFPSTLVCTSASFVADGLDGRGRWRDKAQETCEARRDALQPASRALSWRAAIRFAKSDLLRLQVAVKQMIMMRDMRPKTMRQISNGETTRWLRCWRRSWASIISSLTTARYCLTVFRSWHVHVDQLPCSNWFDVQQ